MCQFAGPYLGGGPLGDSAAAPVPECRQIQGFSVKVQCSPPSPASVRRDGREEIDPEVLKKTGAGTARMAHFSASAGFFVRQKLDFFAERNLFLAAKTQISCRKEIHGRVESGEKRGFGRIFSSGWKPSACKTRLTFCKPSSLSGWRGGCARPHGVPWRAAKCRGSGASRFHFVFQWVRENRAFPPVPAPAPVCAILAGPVLTF